MVGRNASLLSRDDVKAVGRSQPQHELARHFWMSWPLTADSSGGLGESRHVMAQREAAWFLAEMTQKLQQMNFVLIPQAVSACLFSMASKQNT